MSDANNQSRPPRGVSEEVWQIIRHEVSSIRALDTNGDRVISGPELRDRQQQEINPQFGIRSENRNVLTVDVDVRCNEIQAASTRIRPLAPQQTIISDGPRENFSNSPRNNYLNHDADLTQVLQGARRGDASSRNFMSSVVGQRAELNGLTPLEATALRSSVERALDTPEGRSLMRTLPMRAQGVVTDATCGIVGEDLRSPPRHIPTSIVRPNNRERGT